MDEQKCSTGSVRLILLTDIPLMGGRVAILQCRGEFNHERMAPESYPGTCQVTMHGDFLADETLSDAIRREVPEKLGRKLSTHLSTALATGQLCRICKKQVSKEGTLVTTLAGILPPKLIPYIRLNASSGGLVFITEERINGIIPLYRQYEHNGIRLRYSVAMFPDEIEATSEAFRVFREQNTFA